MRHAIFPDSRSRVVMAALVALLTVPIPVASQSTERVSAFGRYSGYSEASYDGWSRHAEYVPMLDGVLIAVNYFIPTTGGREASDPLPVILVYTRYLRVWEAGDGTVNSVIGEESFLQDLLRHGYVLAVANARGTGASFGSRNGEFTDEETDDAYEIVEWLAAQDWSDSHVGMWGRSYSGMTAYFGATQAPPHLEAVFSEMAGPVLYDFVYQGGVYKDDFVNVWGRLTKQMDLGQIAPPARMDSDASGNRRDSAVAEHADNLWAHTVGVKAKHRDSSIRRKNGGIWSWEMASSIHGSNAIKEAGVPVYHLLGWYDQYATQQAMMYANLKPSRQKMTIGPWTHSAGFGGEIHRAEVRRWFDRWLKGIDNGIMREKPVHYFLMRGNNTVPDDAGQSSSQDEIDAEDGRLWRATKRWPPRYGRPKRYFFKGGPSGTVASSNDGRLVKAKPGAAIAKDKYIVDYSSTMGSYSRWMDGYGADRDEPPGTQFFDERTGEDERALTYTSAPLGRNQAIIGYPVVHLWVSSTHRDGGFFVYLEEVDTEGNSHYVTEGMLRASHRAVAQAPWKNFRLPFHPSRKEDLVDLPQEPVELVVDLMGTAIVIDAGHRIRVTVAGADKNNHARYPGKKGGKVPRISIYRNRVHSSYIELPMTGVN